MCHKHMVSGGVRSRKTMAACQGHILAVVASDHFSNLYFWHSSLPDSVDNPMASYAAFRDKCWLAQDNVSIHLMWSCWSDSKYLNI